MANRSSDAAGSEAVTNRFKVRPPTSLLGAQTIGDRMGQAAVK
jgi:hypothetical protein